MDLPLQIAADLRRMPDKPDGLAATDREKELLERIGRLEIASLLWKRAAR